MLAGEGMPRPLLRRAHEKEADDIVGSSLVFIQRTVLHFTGMALQPATNYLPEMTARLRSSEWVPASTSDPGSRQEVVSNAACELPDCLQLLRTDHARVRRLECSLCFAAFGDIPCHLVEAAGLVPDGVDHDVCPKHTAVLSDPLTFMLPAPVSGCRLQAGSRKPGGTVGFRIKFGKMPGQ